MQRQRCLLISAHSVIHSECAEYNDDHWCTSQWNQKYIDLGNFHPFEISPTEIRFSQICKVF